MMDGNRPGVFVFGNFSKLIRESLEIPTVGQGMSLINPARVCIFQVCLDLLPTDLGEIYTEISAVDIREYVETKTTQDSVQVRLCFVMVVVILKIGNKNSIAILVI